ncbi:MAG: hypothetical protein AB1797_01725 [bacterium]
MRRREKTYYQGIPLGDRSFFIWVVWCLVVGTRGHQTLSSYTPGNQRRGEKFFTPTGGEGKCWGGNTITL